jgi:hypothetical protein
VSLSLFIIFNIADVLTSLFPHSRAMIMS